MDVLPKDIFTEFYQLWSSLLRTMWNPANGSSQTEQVAARMETTPSLGSASISVSQQQAPKKFAPVVAPKPKFNPYKQGESSQPDPAGTKPTPGPKAMFLTLRYQFP